MAKKWRESKGRGGGDQEILTQYLISGLLGREIVHALGREQQWPTVHASSRFQDDQHSSNVEYHFLDLTNDAQDMAKQLQDVEAQYVFAAYLQKDTDQENWDINGKLWERDIATRSLGICKGAMLTKFLDALKIQWRLETDQKVRSRYRNEVVKSL